MDRAFVAHDSSRCTDLFSAFFTRSAVAVVVHIDETNLFHFNQAKFGRLNA